MIALHPDRRPQTPTEELINALTHGLAALAAVCGMVVLLTASRHARVTGAAIPLTIYAASLLLLYACSTCYHCVRSKKWKRIFRSIDHAAIYLLIAGTYTPIMLLLIGGTWGIAIVATLWATAAVGVIIKSICVEKMPLVSTIIYCIMGWAGVIAIRPILTHLPIGCVFWIVAGGILYTSGIAFYRSAKLYHHAIWHLFVIAGSAAHFIAIDRYIL